MARKRGGIAGLWDRRKNIIRPAAELVAGAFGGPWAGAAAGAAMRGLDRPGKSGIGFDFGEGVRGGLEGYSLGNVGSWAGGKMGVPQKDVGQSLKNLFTGKAPETLAPPSPIASAPSGPSAGSYDAAALTDKVKYAPPAISGQTVNLVDDTAKELAKRAPTDLMKTVPPRDNKFFDAVKNNQYLLGTMFSSLAGQGGEDAKAEYTKAQTALLKKQMELEEEARQSAAAKSDLLAKLLIGGFYGRPTVTI